VIRRLVLTRKLQDWIRLCKRIVRIASYRLPMAPAAHVIDHRAPAEATGGLRRRNRAEALVRDRLASIEDVYVFRSSWHRNGAGPEPLVAVIARDDEARHRAQEALADIAGFPAEQWQTSWTPLDLGDWMVWVYPERAVA